MEIGPGMGSRSAPIGTPSYYLFSKQHQELAPDSKWGPDWVLKHSQRIERQSKVGMSVDIDKAGRENTPCPVDLPRCGFSPPLLHGGNSPIAHRNADSSSGTSNTVDRRSR